MAKLTEQELEEAARRIVESSCRKQGLEVQITDPVIIGKVATIFSGDAGVYKCRRGPAPSGAMWPLTHLHFAQWLCGALGASTLVDRMEKP